MRLGTLAKGRIEMITTINMVTTINGVEIFHDKNGYIWGMDWSKEEKLIKAGVIEKRTVSRGEYKGYETYIYKKYLEEIQHVNIKGQEAPDLFDNGKDAGDWEGGLKCFI